jgi:hypothetical protein
MYNREFIAKLADEYGEDPEDIRKALWLSEHIRQTGIDETRFMRRTSAKLRTEGPSKAKENVSSELKKRFE